MTIQAIMNAEQSTAKQATNAAKMRSNHYGALEDEKVTAIDAVHHYFQHNCAATMVNVKQLFQDYGTKKSVEAFSYLSFNFTGAKADNSKDQARHDKAVPAYLKELATIEEVGLTVWYKMKTASTDGEVLTDEQKKAKKDASKAAKEKAIGEAYLAEQVANDPSFAVAMDFMTAYNALAVKNQGMATDMAKASIKKLGDSLTTVLTGLTA